jgi:manganese oxidase
MGCFQMGEHKNAKGRCCFLALFVFLAGTLLTVGRCSAADRALPAISVNDNRLPAGRLEAGVLTLHLELREGWWHPEAPDGRVIDTYAFAEEGHEPQTPGPLIRVPQGTQLHISFHNLLPTAITLHGFHQHPGKAEDVMQLAPGETRQAQFAAGEPGSYIYSASISPQPTYDIDGEMAGALIVDTPTADTADRIFVIQLWDQNVFHRSFNSALTINGKSWPYTERLQARIGQAEHWRILNASPIVHPMHLHGFYYYVDAVGDGESEQHYTAAERRMVVTEALIPGHTFEMTWMPERPGNWLFHCHVLDHMDSYFSPVLYGPKGPPPMEHGPHGAVMGMAKLVLGISVTGEPVLKPAAAVVPPVAAEMHLFVRERPATSYAPAGPGFFLAGVSQQVGPIGPPLVLTRGVRTAITVTNELQQPTAIHWHGLEIESYYDGVAGWGGTAQHATPPIAPGGSFVAYMTPPRAGTFIYHVHWHDAEQLIGGMYGPLLVLPPGQTFDPTTDKVFVLGRSGLNEMLDPLVLNGSPQPSMMVLLLGPTYRLRFVNIAPNDALVEVSLSCNGHPEKWRAIAKDGADLPPQQATVRDALWPISVGETGDFEFTPKTPGSYQLRFTSRLGREVTQGILVVPHDDPLSVYAAKR